MGPVTGLGGQQQYQVSNNFQPGQANVQANKPQEERVPKENTVQTRQASAAQAQRTQTDDLNGDVNVRNQSSVSFESFSGSSSGQRGSVLDINV